MRQMTLRSWRRQGLRRSVRRILLQETFAALRYPNYRLWFFGQMVSLFGTWMQSTAQGYLIYQLTTSPVYLGYVAFASGVPSWLFMLYGGVVADRVPRRTLLVITQTAMMILAFILGALAFLHLVQPWHIIVLAFALGVANAFDAPARQSFVLEMVEREHLINAIALNGMMFNAAVAVGPAVGGLTYALFGPAWCFTLNGLSFIAVIIALLLMRLKPFVPPPRRNSALADLRDGLRYTVGHSMIRALILVVMIVNLFGVLYATLIPAWAVDVLHGDATTNGLLQSARGVGAVLAALVVASLGRSRFKGRLLTLGMFVFPIVLCLFALARSLSLSLLTMVAVGAAQILIFNVANSLVQTLARDEMRGRVMGLYSLVFFGLTPFGGLMAGAAAEQFGEPATVIAGALVSLSTAVAAWLFLPRLRTLP